MHYCSLDRRNACCLHASGWPLPHFLYSHVKTVLWFCQLYTCFVGLQVRSLVWQKFNSVNLYYVLYSPDFFYRTCLNVTEFLLDCAANFFIAHVRYLTGLCYYFFFLYHTCVSLIIVLSIFLVLATSGDINCNDLFCYNALFLRTPAVCTELWLKHVTYFIYIPCRY